MSFKRIFFLLFIVLISLVTGIVIGLNFNTFWSYNNVMQRPEQIDAMALLKEADSASRYILNKVHYNYPRQLRRAGVLTNHRKEPNYEDIINQLHRLQDRYNIKATVYEMVGYDNGVPIVYILEHYDEWRKMKGRK